MAEITFEQLIQWYTVRNYDYLWLKAMLEKAAAVTTKGSTLITGSSHALNGIYEPAWRNAVNCSMHSQDLYYDFVCARRVLETPGAAQQFSRCFIVMGYYIAFQDLSLSKVSRESVISNVYYPVLGDAHNWKEPVANDPWRMVNGLSDIAKQACERGALRKLKEYGTYYSQIRPRGTLFDLKGRKWADITMEEREALGRYRADSHNRIFQHKDSFQENKVILKEFVHFLHLHQITPVVVITPFADAYNRHILPEMKAGVLNLVDSVPDDVHYVDFNEASELFDASDFMDTDHLSESGAKKVSGILTELFGT